MYASCGATHAWMLSLTFVSWSVTQAYTSSLAFALCFVTLSYIIYQKSPCSISTWFISMVTFIGVRSPPRTLPTPTRRRRRTLCPSLVSLSFFFLEPSQDQFKGHFKNTTLSYPLAIRNCPPVLFPHIPRV